MLRILITSTVLTSAPLLYFLRPQSIHQIIMSIGLIIAIFLSLAILVRRVQRQTRAHTQRNTIHVLVRGGETLDLILAEAERRAGRKGTP